MFRRPFKKCEMQGSGKTGHTEHRASINGLLFIAGEADCDFQAAW